ncbi:kinase-like domain-containing protein [Suillus ampliporus]|nr:kinase-like domain-containing protein [Suillus ampliporus]
MDPCDNYRPTPALPTVLSSPTSPKARPHRLFTWWPVRAGHAPPPIVDVALARGQLRRAAPGAPNTLLSNIWPAQEAQPSTNVRHNGPDLLDSEATARPAVLPHLPTHPRNPLLPSCNTDAVLLPVHNDRRGDSPPEAMFEDLTRYIVKDEDYPVARGGFGEIWKCTYQQDQTPIKVAVKSLQVYAADQLGAAKKKKIKRIERELRICASFKHANILPVYGYTSGFGPFIAIVSPWAENGNLTAYLEREGENLTLVRRFQILADIMAVSILDLESQLLLAVHVNRVVHGDFTGPNVLIHGDGTACVADFGLSLMYSEVISASQASWTSTLKGNMRWMAPELLVEGEEGPPARPSKQSDIYSFGGIMLQVLTNKVPYYHLTNDAAIILCIAKLQMPSRSRYPVLSDKYWQVIEQCWSANPQDRPSTESLDREIRNEFDSLSGSR